LLLLPRDPEYVDRLAAFLRSVGLEPRPGTGHQLEVDADSRELEVYLRVWRVMYPDVEVLISDESSRPPAVP
jgi:hypothetical protein